MPNKQQTKKARGLKVAKLFMELQRRSPDHAEVMQLLLRSCLALTAEARPWQRKLDLVRSALLSEVAARRPQLMEIAVESARSFGMRAA